MSEIPSPRRGRRLKVAQALLLAAGLTGLLTACAGRHPAGGPLSQPMTAYILPPVAETAQGPRLRITVPRRDLVFRRDAGIISGGLEVTVVAWSDGRQVGGGVSRAKMEVDCWESARSDSLFRLELPVILEADQTVDLEVRARSLGSSRRWVRRIPCPPSAWRPLPYTLSHWEWNADAQGVLDGADSLRVDLTLVRQAAVAWPEADFGVGLRLKSSWEGDARVLRSLPPTEAGSDTVRARLALSAGELPLGPYEMELGLGNPAGGGAEMQIRVRCALRSLVLDPGSDAAWREHLQWLEDRLEPGEKGRLAVLPPEARGDALRRLFSGPEELRSHLLRVVEADSRFAYQGRGAGTDRGKIFVKHGEPARIERKGSPGDRFQRWEIWFYGPGGPTFTFLDSHGLGEYRLIKRVSSPG